MQPFEIVPGWRISPTDRQYALERLSTPKEGSERAPTWTCVGYHGKIAHALSQWTEVAIRESEEPLPEAVAKVRADVERIAALIGGRDLVIQV